MFYYIQIQHVYAGIMIITWLIKPMINYKTINMDIYMAVKSSAEGRIS